MNTMNFPRDIYYKATDSTRPQEIPAGHFIEHMGLYELLEESTDPDAREDAFYGPDLLITRAGTMFNTETRSAHWCIEIMNQEGFTATIIGAKPLLDCDLRIGYSRQPF